MAYNKKKYYVVWEGRATGVFDSWEECKLQVENFPGARYKAFNSQNEAVEAFRGSPDEYIGILKTIAAHKAAVVNYESIPQIPRGAIAVDAACSRNPGPVEYQCVEIDTGRQLFHVGPLEGGTNNIGEFLAIVHALAMLDKLGRHDVTIFSDSRTAQSWVRNKHARTAVTPDARNAKIMELVRRAEAWLQTHRVANPIVKWDTDNWGEIPADFGRK